MDDEDELIEQTARVTAADIVAVFENLLRPEERADAVEEVSGLVRAGILTFAALKAQSLRRYFGPPGLN